MALKDAIKYIEEYEPNDEYSSYYHEEVIEEMINKAKKDALAEACNVVKTYKIGNSGSWRDAAVDKSPIIELIKQCQ